MTEYSLFAPVIAAASSTIYDVCDFADAKFFVIKAHNTILGLLH